jgi:hypothetical protein
MSLVLTTLISTEPGSAILQSLIKTMPSCITSNKESLSGSIGNLSPTNSSPSRTWLKCLAAVFLSSSRKVWWPPAPLIYFPEWPFTSLSATWTPFLPWISTYIWTYSSKLSDPSLFLSNLLNSEPIYASVTSSRPNCLRRILNSAASIVPSLFLSKALKLEMT